MSGPAATGKTDPIGLVGRVLRWLGQWVVGYAVVLVTLPVRFLLYAPLVIVARSWQGRAFGAFGLWGLAVTGLVAGYWLGRVDADWPDWVATTVIGTAGVLIVAMFLIVFSTRRRALENPAPGFWSYAPGYIPAGRPPWWKARFVFLPETDLVRLGVAWITRFDPWMTRAEARTIRRVMRGLLAGMDADPGYRELAPIWWAVEHAFLPPRWPPLLWHQFAYFPPPTEPGRRLGTLIFLHGHGPNLALYLHTWRRFADEHGFAVVCPSFGFGNWEHPDGVQAVAWALETARASGVFDEDRVYLAGISQGGAGVGRAGAALPGAFAGLVFISPTMEPDVLGSPEFVEGWKGRPVLVVHGDRDRNVRPEGVAAAAEQMAADGVRVTHHRDPDAGHFLFFAQLDEVHRLVGGWMGDGANGPV